MTFCAKGGQFGVTVSRDQTNTIAAPRFNPMMDKEADMNVDQELSLVYRKILHFIPSLLLPTSRGFLVYMMVRFILIRQELLKSCITLAFPVI